MNKHLTALLIIFIWLINHNTQAQIEVPFSSEKWNLVNANIEEHLGEQALKGIALLNDIEISDGIIEVDIAMTGERSYPGIVFRMEDMQNYERFYIRPHRSGLYPDALQYVPVINGIAGWQLYIGDGYSNETPKISTNKWVHVKIEIKGSQARIFIDNKEYPSLEIHKLKTGIKKGSIGLYGPKDSTAYFANFKYTIANNLAFKEPPYVDTIPGLFKNIEISQPFTLNDIEFEKYPSKKILDNIKWQNVKQEPNGLIDFSNYTGRTSRQPNTILAKVIVSGSHGETKQINFGYSDAISIFHNKNLIFSGNSSYRYRDPSFLGIIGLFDSFTLKLEEGDNEILFAITESFGGWGLMAQDADCIYEDKKLTKIWESEKSLKMPESAVFDETRNCIYVSNYDGYNPSRGKGMQSISKITSDGKIIQQNWIQGFNNPTGITIFNDELYVVDRIGIIKINLEEEKVADTISIENASFLNDIAIDNNGNIYVSDNNANVIYRCSDHTVEKWLSNNEVERPNGLYIMNNYLIWGNNGSRSLKQVDLATQEIQEIKILNEGIIDGVSGDKEGNIYLSHNEGRLFKIDKERNTTKLLDLTTIGVNLADFCYSNSNNTFYIPTFRNNNIVLYKENIKQ